MTGTTGTIKNAIFNFDGTLFHKAFIWEDFLEEKLNELEDYCKLYCKKWCFQAEVCPSTGRRHIQLRISLKKKCRKPPFLSFSGFVGNEHQMPTVNWSATSNHINNANFFDYCTKNESAIENTCKRSDDEIIYIPRQIRDITEWYPWQDAVIASLDVFDKRHINWLYCPTGNIGKSTLSTYCRCKKLARTIPMINDYKELMGAVIDMQSKAYMLDMPRALKKDKQFQILGAIETIKDGYAFDTRYKYREINFDCPVIWVFSNQLPDKSYLSNDRWLIWTVEDKQLIKYNEQPEIDRLKALKALNKGLDSDSEDDLDFDGTSV